MDYPTTFIGKSDKINPLSRNIYYFFNYYPSSKVETMSPTDKRRESTERIWKLKKRDKKAYPLFASCVCAHVKDLGNEEWLACTIPGHDQVYASANPMDSFLSYVYLPKNIHPVIGLIIRNKEMPKKHGDTYGDRTPERDYASYKIGNTRNIKGQNIIIFDDIVTSGSSLIAARRFLEKNGAKRVVLIALAKTVEDPYYG